MLHQKIQLLFRSSLAVSLSLVQAQPCSTICTRLKVLPDVLGNLRSSPGSMGRMLGTWCQVAIGHKCCKSSQKFTVSSFRRAVKTDSEAGGGAAGGDPGHVLSYCQALSPNPYPQNPQTQPQPSSKTKLVPMGLGLTLKSWGTAKDMEQSTMFSENIIIHTCCT